MSDHEQTLREMANCPHCTDGYVSPGLLCIICEQRITPTERAACLSGADALMREKQTCGNCAHRIDWPDAIGCNNGRGLNRDEVSPGDFCSEWATREAE